MNNILKLFLAFFVAIHVNGQELEARVSINSDNINGSNKQVYETLERDLTEFINQTEWTNKNYKSQEKIDLAITLTILSETAQSGFTGNIQVLSVRPVYNSTYLSTIFNYKDNDVSFQYTEFETFQFNRNQFDSNLTSIIAYYVFMVLGLDGDTFEENGGTRMFDEAENVVNLAQGSGYIGWNANAGKLNRHMLVNEMLSSAYEEFRGVMYEYHFNGLDIMFDQKLEAKENIANALERLEVIHDRRPNSPLIRIFMDAKSDEILNIFSGGPRFDSSELKDALIRVSGSNSLKWETIK